MDGGSGGMGAVPFRPLCVARDVDSANLARVARVAVRTWPCTMVRLAG